MRLLSWIECDKPCSEVRKIRNNTDSDLAGVSILSNVAVESFTEHYFQEINANANLSGSIKVFFVPFKEKFCLHICGPAESHNFLRWKSDEIFPDRSKAWIMHNVDHEWRNISVRLIHVSRTCPPYRNALHHWLHVYVRSMEFPLRHASCDLFVSCCELRVVVFRVVCCVFRVACCVF